MAAEIREELLSAYLDGELSAEDRARVEKFLASSAEWRQLLDELRSVRSSMQSLARHKLPEDLCPAVLRRAERAGIGGPQQPAAAGKITPGTVVRSWWSRGGRRRMLWPVAAIAAALLIAFLDTDRKPAEKQVAQTRAPKGETFIGARQLAEEQGENKSQNLSRHPGDEIESETMRENSAFAKSAENQNVPLLEPKMAPAAPSSAAAPSSRAAENAGRSAGLLRKETATSPDDTLTIVCDVTSAFVRDRGFEKLLDEQQIAYRQSDQLHFPEADLNDRYGKAGKEPVLRPYLVEATPAQVDRIMALLRNDALGVSKVVKHHEYAKSRARDERLAQAANKPTQLDANVPARVKFVLRIVEPPPSSDKEP
ncbi:MAG: zf-HC2 domain-containing protein [Planctomycetia bacterium]|nr:zf-HC2 domain-containing protein [Planctomycetia bacterium]